MSNCIYCQKELPEHQTNYKPKRFCLTKCYQNWRYENDPVYRQKAKQDSKRRISKLKNKPSYKKAQAKRTKEWVNKNRERYNTLMRKSMRKRLNIKPENYKIK